MKPTIACKIFNSRCKDRGGKIGTFLISSEKNKDLLGFHQILDMTYLHPATQEHFLTVMRRKWQRKPARSDKHMNLWICEREPQRANVMLSGARAVYSVELDWEGLLIYTFCRKSCLDESCWLNGCYYALPLPNLSMNVHFPLRNKDVNSSFVQQTNQYDNVFYIHLQAVCFMAPTRVIHFNAPTGIISHCCRSAEWRRTTDSPLQLGAISNFSLFVIGLVIGLHIWGINSVVHCKMVGLKEKKWMIYVPS